ncbi:MAG: winged helix DNA-binding domain-containing protein [Chloroflexi bacterium]|nr:winged helix DNA-binding domain-containing protein [Chloroflexota bacterium]
MGNYDRAELDRLLWEERTLFEYWAHAASIVLTEEYPVHQWHMRRRRDADFERYLHSRLNGDVDVPALTQTILARLARDKASFLPRDQRWHRKSRSRYRLVQQATCRASSITCGRRGTL